MVQHWFAHPIRGNPSCDHGRLATPLCRESGVADSCGKECQSGRERAAFRIFFHRRGLHRGRRRHHRGHNFVAKRRNCFQKSPARLYCPRQPKGQRRLSQHRHLIMRTDLLVRRTRMHFPRFDVAEIKIAPINKGGSDRKFYRIHCSPDQTLILVKYNLEREENRHYVQIADFLDAHDIRVPKIYFHDPTEGLIWIEDLGESDLYSYRHESWLVRRAFYESALDQIATLHALPESVCVEMKEHLPAEFNTELYVWEQNYFFENCLGRYFGMNEAHWRELAALAPLKEIAEWLASFPRVLVHRDFQSQNVIIQNGQANLINFQGSQPCLAYYDLASLLYDPYIDVAEAERAELIAYYRGRQLENGITIDGDFDLTLRLCAIQRLMQALGAYGFLGLVRGHKNFLQYIPRAVRSLRHIVAKVDNLKPLASFLEELREESSGAAS